MPSRMARSTSSRVTAGVRGTLEPGHEQARSRCQDRQHRKSCERTILRTGWSNLLRTFYACSNSREPHDRASSGQRGVDDDVGGDLEGRLVGVALAVEPGVPFQGAADVVLGVDDGPVAVDLDALELGKVLAAAGGLGVLDVGEVEADLGGVELVVAGDGDQGVVGEELGDEPAEGGVEGGAAAGGVGEERAAAGLDVPPQGVEVLLGEGERGAAVEVDQG